VNKAFSDAGFIQDRRPLKVRNSYLQILAANVDSESAALHNSQHFVSQTISTTVLLQRNPDVVIYSPVCSYTT
jgi:hypothetical protein